MTRTLPGILLTLFAANNVMATTQEQPLSINRQTISADELVDLSSKLDLVPVNNAALESRIKAVRQNSVAVTPIPSRVIYKASMNDAGLLQGTFVASFTDDDPEVLSLSQPSFEITGVDTAKWGADADGRVLVERTKNTIPGGWRLKGQPRAWGREFSFEGFDSTTSQLVLTLPAQIEVQSNGVILAKSPSEDGTRTWKIIPLALEPTTLTFVAHQSQRDPTPVLDTRITWSIGPDNTMLEADFNLQTSQPISSFTLPLPPGTTVESISYGDSATLPIDVSGSTTSRVLNVQLPQPLLGASRPFVLSARLAPTIGVVWSVPTLSIATCTTPSGQTIRASSRQLTQRFRVTAPLELQRVELSGFRQTDSLFDLDGTHTIRLQRLFPNATAELKVGLPTRQTRLSVLNKLTWNQQAWLHTSFVFANTQLPSRVQLTIPDGVSVLRVGTGLDGATACDFTQQEGSSQLQVLLATTEATVLRIDAVSKSPPVQSLTTTPQPTAQVVSLPSESLKTDVALTELTATEAEAVLPATRDAELFTPSHRHFMSPGKLDLIDQQTPAPTQTSETIATPPVGTHVASLTLNSRLGYNRSRHTAVFETQRAGDFVFELPGENRIARITVNGTPSRFSRIEDIVTVPTETNAATNRISVHYESVTQSQGMLNREHRIPVPMTQATGSFEWTLDTPDGTRLLSSSPIQFSTPIGRSWRHLLGPFFKQESTYQSTFGPVEFSSPPPKLRVVVRDASMVAKCAWVALALGLIAGMLVLRVTSEMWLAFGCAAMGLCTMLVGHPVSQICGGAFLGLLVATLIGNPSQVFAQQPNRHFRRAIQAMQLGLIASVSLWIAQTGSAQEPDSTKDGFRVLKLPNSQMAYADRALLDLLDEAATETTATAIQNALYEMQFSRTTCTVEATLTVLTTDGDVGELRLPFGLANVTACKVNNESTVFNRVEDDILVPIPAKAEDESITAHTVVLTLYPPVRDARSTFSIPNAGGSAATVTLEDPGAVTINGQAIGTEPTRIADALTVAYRDKTEKPIATAQPELTNECQITLGASEVVFEHKLRIAPGDKPLHHFDLELPPSQRFVSLNGSVPCRQRVFADATKTHLAIDFLQPVNEAAELTIRLATTLGDLSKPQSFEILPLSTTDTDSVSIAAAADFKIAAIELHTDDAPPEDLLEQIAPQDATVAINLDREALIIASVSELLPSRDVRLTQRALVTATKVAHTFKGLFDIKNGPVFSHSLEIDERLVIETVTVRENNVDRLARYQRNENQLLLLLDGQTSGIQEVTIEARLPRTIDTASQLPEIRVQDANVSESTLVLESDNDIEIILENTNGVPFAVRPDSLLGGSLTTDREATFRLLETSELPVVRTRRRSPPKIESVCFIQPSASPAEPQATWVYRITNAKPGTQVVVEYPGLDAIVPQSLNSENLKSSTLELTGEPSTFVFRGTVQNSTLPLVRWNAPIDVGNPSVVVGVPDLAPTDGVPSDEPLASWASRYGRPGRAFSLADNGQVVLEQIQSDAQQNTAAVEAMENHVWLGRRTDGFTTIETATAGVLSIRTPTGMNVESLHVNDIERPFTADDGQVRAVLPEGRSAVRLRWSLESRTNIGFPAVDQVPPESLWYLHRNGSNDSFQSETLVALPIDAAKPDTVAFAVADSIDESTADFELIITTPAASIATQVGTALTIAILVFAVCALALTLKPISRCCVGLIAFGAVLMIIGSFATGSTCLFLGPGLWLARSQTA